MGLPGLFWDGLRQNRRCFFVKKPACQAGQAGFSSALNKARDWETFKGDNPVSKVKIPRFDNRRVRFLCREEVEKLLEECRKRTTSNNWIYPMVLIALTTGMRAGEIFRLKWQDVDFENDLIYIRDPKSGGNRVPFLAPEMKEANLILSFPATEDLRCPSLRTQHGLSQSDLIFRRMAAKATSMRKVIEANSAFLV